MSLPGGGRRWFVIVNPVAGGGRGLDHFPLISKLLRDAGIQTEPVFTEHKFHATELTVSAVKQGFRRIIAVGGDGTLHEVVNGLFIQQTVDPREVLLAVVAVGAGNDWIRTFGVPNRYQDAIRAIKEGHSFLQDVGVVSYEEAHYRQHRYMANVAGMGFDAMVVKKYAHLKKKGHRNKWLYTWCMIRSFFSYKSTGVKVWIDDRLVYNNLLMSIAIGVCKYNGGGMQQLPEAVADDGLLDVSLAYPVPLPLSVQRRDLPDSAYPAGEGQPYPHRIFAGDQRRGRWRIVGGVSVGVFRIAPSCSDRGFGGVPQAGELSVVFVQYRLI